MLRSARFSLVVSAGWLLCLLLAERAACSPHSGAGSEGHNYAAYRKGEFLAMQYERAVQLEAEGLKMAAEGRFEDANQKLVICVMMHQQLLGQRHPQLIRPYLAAAENSAKWGDSLGLQGKEQVKKAQEYVDSALLILDSMPLSSKELMGEEELRLKDMKEVLAQMLDALSPPEELVAASRLGPILLPELPKAVRLLEEGNGVYLNLTREEPWAFHAAEVKEGWMHAQTLVGRESKMMVYGIQTVTTAMAITQDSRLRLHAVLATATGGGHGVWTHGDGSRERCRWWNDPNCLQRLSARDFAMTGNQGVGLGRANMAQGSAPAWMHFMELPSDVGSMALLGAEMDPPSDPKLGLSLLKVNEEPMVPLHLGDGLQTWELDGFRASVHYLTWTEETQLHRLEVQDKTCMMMSDTRVLYSWDSIPTTTRANVESARSCLRNHGLKTEFLPQGCWRNGAKEGEMLFIVILNPCSAPTTITMTADFKAQGTPRQRPSKARGSSKARHSKPHAQALEISARQQYAMQQHTPGVFVRAPEPAPFPAWLLSLRELSASAWKAARTAGPLGAVVLFVLLLGLALAGRASLRHKTKPGNLRPPSQRGSARRADGPQPHEGAWWRRWLPTLSELSGALPKSRLEVAGDTEYELNIRRGRVSVSTVQRRRNLVSASPRTSSPAHHPGRSEEQHSSLEPQGRAAEIDPRPCSTTPADTTRSRARRRALGGSRSHGSSPSGQARGPRERLSSAPPTPAATVVSSPAASPLRFGNLARDVLPDLSCLGRSSFGSPAYSAPEDGGDALPDMYHCPITQDIMRDPVFASDGYTYERTAIEDWLKVKRTSPMTNLPFESPILVPNNALRSAILEALDRRGDLLSRNGLSPDEEE